MHVNPPPGFSVVTARGFATQAILTGRTHAFYVATWALIAAVNVSATILICLRLWTVHQRTRIVTLSKYKSTIVIVVECGALVTICTIAILILDVVKHPAGLTGLGVTTQVAVSRSQSNNFIHHRLFFEKTLAPLLIIARHGILSRQDDLHLLSSRIPLRISVVRTQDTHLDPPAVPIRKNRYVPDPFPELPDGNKPKPFSDIY